MKISININLFYEFFTRNNKSQNDLAKIKIKNISKNCIQAIIASKK